MVAISITIAALLCALVAILHSTHAWNVVGSSRCGSGGRRFHDGVLFSADTTFQLETYTCDEPTEHVEATSNNRQSSSQHSVHLLSLPPRNDTYALQGESLVRECWRWKDTMLGDGRDYFVPRPRALNAFHSLFVGMEITAVYDDRGDENAIIEVILKLPSASSVSDGPSEVIEVRLPITDAKHNMNGISIDETKPQSSTSENTFVIDECVALSNCARFDVILVLKSIRSNVVKKEKSNTLSEVSAAAANAARYAVAYTLQQQIISQRSKTKSLLERTGLSSWLDLPDGINTNSIQSNSLTKEQYKEIYQLVQRLTSMEGAYSISNHLCLIAGGLAPRPNRPDREVLFRPYSSRDAREY